MPKQFLRLVEQPDEQAEFQVFSELLPQISFICTNEIRAGILHLLVNSPETLHSMNVETMSNKLGMRPRVVIFHLEKLRSWKLVDVKKAVKYGNKERRSIWGLDLKHPKWIMECYSYLRNNFFSSNELNIMTNKSKSFRKK